MKPKALLVSALVLGFLYLGGWKETAAETLLSERFGRAVIAINDKASLSTKQAGGGLEMETRNLPVVFQKTVELTSLGTVILIGRDLRADKELSTKLYQSCYPNKLASDLKEKVTAELEIGGMNIPDDKKIRAILNRARIVHPVKFADSPSIGFLDISVHSNKNYGPWQNYVASGLKESNLADTLLVCNIPLWGIREGSSKIEGDNEDEKHERFQETGDLRNIFSKKGAMAIIVVEAIVIDTKTGKQIWKDEFNYGLGSPEQTTSSLLADEAVMFKQYTTCLIDWFAQDLRLELSGRDRLNGYECDAVKP